MVLDSVIAEKVELSYDAKPSVGNYFVENMRKNADRV
jgi:hypothetical protein